MNSIARSTTLFVLVVTLTGCNKIGDLVSGGGGSGENNVATAQVRLNAFGQFNCTSNWTERDGALGLSAGSGSGTCSATFPGVSGIYRVQLVAQTEYDGAPPYRVSLNGKTIGSGRYPYSQGNLICSCPDWHINCPDVNTHLDAGVHQIKTGDVIEFWGAEVYECDATHGAYAKWHELVFTPVK